MRDTLSPISEIHHRDSYLLKHQTKPDENIQTKTDCDLFENVLYMK